VRCKTTISEVERRTRAARKLRGHRPERPNLQRRRKEKHWRPPHLFQENSA
jgi:hypothetical protein